MRGGMVSIATCRRFSRPVLISAVSSGRSSVSRSTAAPPAVSEAMRCGTSGAGADAAGRRGLRPGHLEHDADGLPGAIAATGHEQHGVLEHRELAGLLRLGPLRVAEIVQPVDELRLPERLPAPEIHRPREDARQHPVALAVQPRLDLPRELDVVVPEGARHRDGRDRERGQQVPHPPPPVERPSRGARRGAGRLHGGLGHGGWKTLGVLGLRCSIL